MAIDNADLTAPEYRLGPVVNVIPVKFANGATASLAPPSAAASQGPGATMPAGSLVPGVSQGRAGWRSRLAPSAPQPVSNPSNPYSTVEPASTTEAGEIAALQAAVAAQAPTTAATTPATGTSWLDESTLTSSYTNGQVVGAAAVLLGLVYLMKRR